MTLAFGKDDLNLGTNSTTTSARGMAQHTRLFEARASEMASNIISVLPAPHTARFENLNINLLKSTDNHLGGITMLESKQVNYYGLAIKMYRISDLLWISNVMPNSQHLVNQFNCHKMMWMQETYTTDEIEFLFNVCTKVLK